MQDRIFTSLDNDVIFLEHIGIPHEGSTPHSGRYPWGSGEAGTQRASDFRAFATEQRKKINPDTGKRYTDTEIARAWGISSTEARKLLSIDRNAERRSNITRAVALRDSGMSPEAIAEKMGQPVSTVRSWLNPVMMERASSNQVVADSLKSSLTEKPYLDITKGVHAQLGISEEKLKNAVKLLENEGYKVHTIKVEQATNPNKKTTIQVLTKDDVEWKEVWENRDQIRSPLGTWSEDNGRTMRDVKPPVSIDSSRVAVRYAEDGGTKKDGVIELRPGVEDISLGQNHYAQVRIAVDDTHYLKGMAVYSENIPKGYDILVNSNKPRGTPVCGSDSEHSVAKTMKKSKETGEIDEDNPFGSTIRQFDYVGKDGKEHQSAINLVNTDEDWTKWNKTLSSQLLSKQQPALAKRQLDLVYQEKKDQFDEIMKYPNDTIRKKLLEDLADDCDSAAVHLKAAALPRQETKVILPLENIKDNEVYAPTYNNGEEVVLIRYPHGGTFEIPRLIVNNNNKEGKAVIGNAERAVGINSHVAEQLSGADFDGDTVTVIPTVGQNIKTSKPLKALQDWNPREIYKAYEGMPVVGKPKSEGGDGFDTQMQMGKVSNLITDMTIKGATESEIARAVKHSMVVIDAEKHQLDWKQSEKDQNIAQLKERYQSGKRGGASTIISRAKSEKDVVARADRTDIDPKTGKKIFFEAKDARWIDKEGKEHTRHEKSTKMYEADDAYDLVSRDKSGATTKIEMVYADHANRLKSLGNEIRKMILKTPRGKLDTSAKEQYEDEVKSLEEKIRLAEINAPNERLAQAAASKYIEGIKKTRDLSKEDEKKIRSQVIEATRGKAGALRREERKITTTNREWAAIVAGALSVEKTNKILTYMDKEEILSRALPRAETGISTAKKSRAKALLAAGFTWSEVSDAVGVSETTLRKYIGKKE